ncbi:MAG: WhiB family transcriptional regulator [Candidatus Saccharimonadales bacterium]
MSKGIEGETSWMEQAACSDSSPETFFPTGGAGVKIAKTICTECVVREDCLNYAIDNNVDHGIWGGTSERERRRIIRLQK